ncbi:MAG TPA: LacI family DNA-binding transcriptional regulator [Pyrinomonadaceae bacterium]|nr:LacI family DNA-binding transcriptional regulator [Pyrinomonadaceae bacterium]
MREEHRRQELERPPVPTFQTSRIKDVAREAGVSTATVSHVINGTKYVSDDTRRRVLDAIKRCEYSPNAHARSLASGRSNMLGLLISDISNPFFPELVKSIEAAAFERGYNVILLNTNYDPERAAEYVRRLSELKMAGVALMTSELDSELFEAVTRRQVSVVFDSTDLTGERMSNICVDYAAGIEEAVRHLVSLGHRRIAHIAGASRIPSGVIRREAFLDFMKRHLPEEPEPAVYEGDFRLDGGRRAASEILASKELPTAVVAANDMMALGAMREFRKAGLSIPGDISVVGFDDISFAALAEPPLTTVCSPRAEIGRRVVEALVALIERPEEKGTELRIPTHLITRDSTAPPRK